MGWVQTLQIPTSRLSYEPTAQQKSLLHQLGLSLPERLELHAKCSADSAIA
jgi:hypothetical protein